MVAIPLVFVVSFADVRKFVQNFLFFLNKLFAKLKMKILGKSEEKVEGEEEAKAPHILPGKILQEALDWMFTCEFEIKKLVPADDTLIVGCENKLYFLDRKTGDVEQEYDLDKPLTDLAYKDGDIFLFHPGEVICLPPYLYPRWKLSLRYDNFLLDKTRLFLYDGISHKIHCLKRESGEELWSKLALMFFNFYDWTQDEDNIYIFGGRWVHAWRKADGEEIWKYDRGEWTIMGGQCGEEAIYVVDYFCDLIFCLNKNGDKLWEYYLRRLGWVYLERPFDLKGITKISLLPLGKGAVVASAGDVFLFRDNGEVIWQTKADSEYPWLPFPLYSPILYTKGEKYIYFMVFVYAKEWEVYRVKLSDGEMEKIMESRFLNVLNADDRYLYLGTLDGKVYALNKGTLS
jgi:outer membrane protein assembly factor BamB